MQRQCPPLHVVERESVAEGLEERTTFCKVIANMFDCMYVCVAKNLRCCNLVQSQSHSLSYYIMPVLCCRLIFTAIIVNILIKIHFCINFT